MLLRLRLRLSERKAESTRRHQGLLVAGEEPQQLASSYSLRAANSAASAIVHSARAAQASERRRPSAELERDATC
eukprot:6882226-Prymnesium_polylepis.1